MGDLFTRWLTPPDGPSPLRLPANRFDISAYALPDTGHLSRHLDSAGQQQFAESDWYVARLREAIGAWQQLADSAVLVVLRQVFNPSVYDAELNASLRLVPGWLLEERASRAEPRPAPDRD